MASRELKRATTTLLVGAMCLLVAFAPADGQSGPRLATRAELQTLLEAKQQEAIATEDRRLREELRVEIEALSIRLREGDIWAGDVISLAVAGEAAWTGNFTVTPSRTLQLPQLAPIAVNNLLYSELEGHLARELGQYLREPRVHAEALKRVAVLGAVGSPGFLTTSGSTIVADLIMQAGGPVSTAKVDDAEFRRLGKRVGFRAGPVAFQSHSLDDLGIRSGDELHIPARGPGTNFWMVMGAVVSLTGAILFALYQF